MTPDTWLFLQVNDLAAATPWLQPGMAGYARDGLVVALARVYIAAHHPLDALTGLVVGAAVAVGGWRLARPALMALLDRIERTRFAPVFVPRPAAGAGPTGD